jgi:pantoate--beta-alanine ligase
LLWAPAVEDIYPEGFATKVSVGAVSKRWEGEARPGHFDGVATIVAKLLLAMRPDVALFGEKDFQQLVVIRRLVADLGIPVEIVGVPTVREPDGVALSSRNAYLSTDGRQRAVALPDALKAARDAIRGGSAVGNALRTAKQSLVEAGFLRIDYFALVDAATLEPLEAPQGEMRLIAAAVIGTTRLIDNITV